MKRSEHRRSGIGCRITEKQERKGWPLCHLYQVIGAALIFLCIVLFTREGDAQAEQHKARLQQWLNASVEITWPAEWKEQWKNIWEEWKDESQPFG